VDGSATITVLPLIGSSKILQKRGIGNASKVKPNVINFLTSWV